MSNTGYQPPSPEEFGDSIVNGYVLGAKGGMRMEEINPSGDWTDYIPSFESQRRSIETSSCTEYGTISAIQILEKFKFGEEHNYSERALAILAENTPSGNSPHKVADTIRKFGLVPEEYLPFDDSIQSWDEYMDAEDKSIMMKGQEWLDKYEFNHEWVKTDPEVLMIALKTSPVGVAVYAWNKEDGYFTKPNGANDNHWTLNIVGYKEGEYWLIWDSYLDDGEPFKKLPWDYNFGFAKVYYLNKRKPSLWDRFISWISGLIHRLKK